MITLKLATEKGKAEARKNFVWIDGQRPGAGQHRLTRQATPIASKVNWKDWSAGCKPSLQLLLFVYVGQYHPP